MLCLQFSKRYAGINFCFSTSNVLRVKKLFGTRFNANPPILISSCFRTAMSLLEPGDLIFWSLSATNNSSPASAASDADFAKAVMRSFKQKGGGKVEGAENCKNVFHVSMLAKLGGKGAAKEVDGVEIIHATTDGVIVEPLKEYASRAASDNEGAVILITKAKVNVDKSVKQAAVQWALSKVGLPYNDIFASNGRNSSNQPSFYCCQLIKESYAAAKSPVAFPTQPMNFRDESKNQVLPFWAEYFRKKNRPIPENEPGSHPALFLCDKKLVTVLDSQILH